MNKFKNNKLTLILVLVLTVLLVSGGTFAYFQWQSSLEDKTNVIVSVTDDIEMRIDPAEVTKTGMRPTNNCGGDFGMQGTSLVTIDNNTGILARPRFNLKLKITDKDGNNITNETSPMGNPYRQYIKYAVAETDGSCTSPLSSGIFNLNTETSTGSGWYESSTLTLNDADGFPAISDGTNSGVSFNAYADNVTTHRYKVWIWIDETYTAISTGNTVNVDKLQDATITVSWSENSTVEQVHGDAGNSGVVNANAPVLDSTGMIPVKIANNGTVTTVSKTDSSWYNYDNKQWANAVLVKQNGTQQRSYYLNNTNVEVNQNDILAYYVWIPKYKYKIWLKDGTTTSSPQEIDIVFEAKDIVTTGSEVGDYMTHPAFNFGGQNLSGIWVGKFETSASPDSNCFKTSSNDSCNNTTTEPRILPGVHALNYQYIVNQFMTSLKFSGGTMNSTSGVVTFEGSTTFGLANTTNSHMMKNSEWGAVAYLSHSKYGTCTNGTCSEIRKNNYWNITNGKSETGCGASEALANSTTTVTDCAIPYGESTSYPQSTTGNISGVFDMSGGLFEYVMGNFNNKSDTTYFPKLPESKYYDVYSITSNSSCTLPICGGHALFETVGWYSDNVSFVNSGNLWFMRGGFSYDGSSTGAFSLYDNNAGLSFLYFGFRSVLVAN